MWKTKRGSPRCSPRAAQRWQKQRTQTFRIGRLDRRPPPFHCRGRAQAREGAERAIPALGFETVDEYEASEWSTQRATKGKSMRPMLSAMGATWEEY